MNSTNVSPVCGNAMVYYGPHLLRQCVCLHTTLNQINGLRSTDEALELGILEQLLFNFMQCLVRLDRALDSSAQV